MSVTPSAPYLRRITPAGWAVTAWLAGLAFTFLLRVRLPGQERADILAGVAFLRWDGLTLLALATALAVRGGALLARRPAAALRHLLAAAVVGTTPLSVTAIPLAQYLAVDVALYVVAASRPAREANRALLLALGVLVAYLAVRLLSGWSVGTTGALAVGLTAAVAWLLGRFERQSRTHAEETRVQAAERAAERAVAAERLRVAREMHDTVAHSIGIVALQAGAARRVITTQPDAARQALAEIETASRDTLAGLRRMVGALRTPDTGPEPPASGEPHGAGHPGLPDMPGLAALDRLTALTAAAGVHVAVRRTGASRPLPPDLDLSAFRLVQEAVTNVVRHSGADSCTVTVDHRDPASLTVTVEDPGPRPGHERARTGGGSGHGLIGMRERVGLLHGRFEAGPRPTGGFRVTARLPVPSPSTSPSPPPATPRPGATTP
ncbi:histidine kinase [Streptomyces sp.]|uniref:sensor histidine kinase n=1 Tax=Streptomyces sp. TaxID=1931 RepID=UPI002812398C|nr:histidine kinase [Streptomyces sp.]